MNRMMLMIWLTVGGAILALWAIWLLRKARARLMFPSKQRRCVCGYLLEGLEVPRCPECGTLVGFERGTTAEELGLSEEELQEAARRKQLRKKMGAGN